jgi:hypothetical protein
MGWISSDVCSMKRAIDVSPSGCGAPSVKVTVTGATSIVSLPTWAPSWITVSWLTD